MKFAHWSVENATKAYLKTLRMVINRKSIDIFFALFSIFLTLTFLNLMLMQGMKRAKEPDVSEFISAIAAGNNAQLIVVACGETVGPSTLLALVAAAHQTGGRVICIFRSLQALESFKQAVGLDEDLIEFVIGDAQRMILEDYKDADFVLLDCKLENHEMILQGMQLSGECKEAIVLGYNAFCTRSWQWVGLRTQLLPIGDGLLLTRIGVGNEKGGGRECGGGSFGRKNHWVVKVDRKTGEEHVFRVRCPYRKEADG